MKVEEITLLKYFSLPDKSIYDYVLEFGSFESNDFFNIGEFTDLKFGLVKDVIEEFYVRGQKMDYIFYLELLNQILNRKEEDFKLLAQYSLFDIYESKLYLEQQIELLMDIENTNFNSQISDEEISADVEMFDKFGSFLSVDRIAVAYSISPEDVLNLPYKICFVKLLLLHTEREYQANIDAMQRIKNKHS